MAGKPGRSGRKPVRPQLTPALRALLGKKVSPELAEQYGDITNRQALVRKTLELAYAGDIQAIKLIFERADGKVADPIEVSGAEGAPLEIFIRRISQSDADPHD